MTRNYGPIATFLEFEGRSWENVVVQKGKPVTSAFMNLLQENGLKPKPVSGWVSPDFLETSDSASFFINSPNPNELFTQPLQALVNGWSIPVVDTGAVAGQNSLTLPPAPVPVGTHRFDLVVLEVWRLLVSAAPSTVGKSPTGRIWRNGNVKIGAALDPILNYPDDILDTNIGFEDSKRVQIQYRLRVVPNVDINAFPFGLNAPGVFANSVPPNAATPDGVATIYTYTNQSPFGDPGLWLAGDGNPGNSLGTVDGYMYAMPMVAVVRRNQTAFDKNTNHNGGVASPGPSDRPDGLFYDILDVRDIIDLRTGLCRKEDLKEILEKNMHLVLDNTLKTEITQTNIGGGSVGHTVLWADEIGITNVHGGNGVTTGDTPGAEFIGEFDSTRRFFSDRSQIETFVVTMDAPGGAWLPNAVVNVVPSALTVYPYLPFNWASYNPAEVVFLDIQSMAWVGENVGKETHEALPHVKTVTGLGSIPPGVVSIQFDGTVPAGLTDERLFIEFAVSWPKGVGLSHTPTNDYAANSVVVNNPAQLPVAAPVSFSSLSHSFDYPHREIQLQYTTTDITLFMMADSNIAGKDTFVLPERADSITVVLRNALPLVGSVVLDSTGRICTFTNAADFTSPGDTIDVAYKALRPLPQNNEQLTIYYETRAPQTIKDAILGTLINPLPRFINESLYTLTVGSGSQDEAYPYPTGYVQAGGVYPSSGGVFNGDYELAAGSKIYVTDFNASVGLLKLPTFVGYTPNPQEVLLTRLGGDVDAEDRTYFKVASNLFYLPNAYAKGLAVPQRHRNFMPVLIQTTVDSSIGPKGMLFLMVFYREATYDKINGFFFDPNLAINTTTASVFRLKGHLISNS